MPLQRRDRLARPGLRLLRWDSGLGTLLRVFGRRAFPDPEFRRSTLWRQVHLPSGRFAPRFLVSLSASLVLRGSLGQIRGGSPLFFNRGVPSFFHRGVSSFFHRGNLSLLDWRLTFRLSFLGDKPFLFLCRRLGLCPPLLFLVPILFVLIR